MSRLLEAPQRPRSPRYRPRHRRRRSVSFRAVGLIPVIVLIAAGAVAWRAGVIDALFVRARQRAVTPPVRPSLEPSPTIAA